MLSRILVFATLAITGFAKQASDGRVCGAKSCSADGVCETRDCMIINPDPNRKPAAKGRIVSCQTCKLNHFDGLRKWLKVDQVHKEYQNLEMIWHQGHDPILFIEDENGNETDRIDLTDYKYEEIGPLLKRKGFRLKGEYW